MWPTARGKSPRIGAEQKDQATRGFCLVEANATKYLHAKRFVFRLMYACFVLHLKREVARPPFRRSLDNWHSKWYPVPCPSRRARGAWSSSYKHAVTKFKLRFIFNLFDLILFYSFIFIILKRGKKETRLPLKSSWQEKKYCKFLYLIEVICGCLRDKAGRVRVQAPVSSPSFHASRRVQTGQR